MIRFASLCLMMMVGTLVFAQNNIRFKNYTIDQGLSQSTVNSMLQDNFGAMWIGTQDGLNKFNGHGFQLFSSDKTEGIKNEYYYCSVKDNLGNLWFGTTNGVTKFEPTSGKFTTYNTGEIYAKAVYDIIVDSDSNLLLATDIGVRKLNISTGQITAPKEDLSIRKVKSLLKINQENLYILSNRTGLTKTNSRLKSPIKVSLVKKDSSSIVYNGLREFSEKQILICTNQGLYVYDDIHKEIKPFLDELDSLFGYLDVMDVLPLSQTEFYIATNSNGLFHAEKVHGKYELTNYRRDIFQPNSLHHDELTKLYQDNKGNIWVGTQRGFCFFNPNNTGFIGVEQSSNPIYGLHRGTVWSFAEDKNQEFLFIGESDGISRYNKEQKLFNFYTPEQSAVNSEHVVLTIEANAANNLYVGATNGLYRLKIEEEEYSYKKIDQSGATNRLDKEMVYKIIRFDETRLIIGTKSGISIYDESTGSFEYIEYTNSANGKNDLGVCRMVYRDNQNRFWVASDAGGINQLQFKDGKFSVRKAVFSDVIMSITNEYITSAHQSNRGDLWFGTHGAGLLRVKNEGGDITIFSKSEGLPNDVVYSIVEDDNNQIWVSTNKGIASINYLNNAVSTYTKLDGLLSNEFNLGAGFKDGDGRIYFGGIKGYNHFIPTELDTDDNDINVKFTSLKLDNEEIKPGDEEGFLTKTIGFTREIILPYRHKSLLLEFAQNNLGYTDEVEYKYVLEGELEEEEILGSVNQIRFTSLSPGVYDLSVYVKHKKGDWNRSPAKLKITVKKPFWMTWWFRITMLVVVSLLVYIYIKRRIDSERRNQVKLEVKIAKRTKEIREKSEKIEQQKEKIEFQKGEVEKQKIALQAEKDKSEALLENILPTEMAQQLKNTGHAVARGFKRVTVMFTDFVGFTQSAEELEPAELVNILDTYFRKFDEIIEKHDVEKIKTIGDAYMCAGGVPIRNKTNPIDTVLAGLEIQNYMNERKKLSIANGDKYWEIRIGINTGEVTAGVIGIKRFAYDIWGRTVNHAQRMESMGIPGKVCVSQSTFDFIEPYFEWDFGGEVKTKSRGMMNMYIIHRLKPELSKKGEGLVPNDKFHKLVTLHVYSKINYMKAERFIIQTLLDGLSDKLHYHSVAHTKDVTRAAERIAVSEGITDEDLFLLKTAATYHDAGFVEQYDKNEPVGARMAEEILPKYGYTQRDIDRIKELIYATSIPHKPKNKLEEIICDADLDYLGRDDFFEIADKLRVELREHGKIDSDRKWDEMQVGFLNMHKYFTQTALDTRQAKKEENLRKVEERLKRDEYAD